MWRRLTCGGIKPFVDQPDKLVVARRASDGKCCVGHVTHLTDMSVTIRNGEYETTLWFTEPRMFYTMATPSLPEIRMAEPELKLG